MTNDNIVFEDPPPPSPQQKGRVAVLIAPLRERPGEWARLWGPVSQSAASSFAAQLRQGRKSGIAAGEFETRTGERDDGWYVWARYVGASG